MDYLFEGWDNLKSRLENKYIFIFLDFDGTLTPIEKTPEKAVLSKKTRELLRELSNSQKLKLAFISGRSLADIKSRIGLKNVIYSGNHGLEIEGPKIKFISQIPLRYKRVIEQIKDNLEHKLSSIKGAFVEDKGLSLALHYRLVEEKQIPQIERIFHETVIIYLLRKQIKIKRGKKVLEVRPPAEWDKGKVVSWLLTREGFALEADTVFPIYIGDDLTDEDAFRALKNRGLTVFVGRPSESCARYYLKDSSEVVEFLQRISRINICQSL